MFTHSRAVSYTHLVTMRGIEEGLKYYSKLEISVAWTIQLYKALEKVPTLQNTIMNR